MFYKPEPYLLPTSHRPSYDSVNSYGSGGGASGSYHGMMQASPSN